MTMRPPLFSQLRLSQAPKRRLAVAAALGAALDLGSFIAMVKPLALAPFWANLAAMGFGLAVFCAIGARPQRRRSVASLLWVGAIALAASWGLARAIGGGLPLFASKLAVMLAASVLVIAALWTIRRIRAWPAQASGALALLAAAGWSLTAPTVPNFGTGLPAELLALYPASPLPVERGLKVFHLGHSLVGRDMPAMLQQLAGVRHDYAAQLGWGTSIAQHLQGPAQINGFELENAHPRYMALSDALRDTSFDVLVVTESVDLRDAITYQNSPAAIADLVRKARAANPRLAIALYETWHPLDQGDWLQRIDEDRAQLWEPALLAPAIRAGGGVPVRLIPAGTVMAAVVRALEADPAAAFSRRDLFSDEIHMNDIGAYLVALTHYASLYGRSPEGLPHQLHRADGRAADAPSAALALRMQRIVWQVVSGSALHR